MSTAVGKLLRLLRRHSVTLGVLVALSRGMDMSSHAAPVKVRVEATISSVLGPPFGGPTDLDAELPFSVHEGSALRGKFTFEPASGSGHYPQNGALEFQIAGHELLASPFEIDVVNDGNGVIDHPGRIADPEGTPDIDRTLFLADRFLVGTPGGISAHSGVLVGNEQFRFAAQIVFEDDVNLQLLTSTELSPDVSIWNDFRNQEVSISFNNGQYVGAYIQSVSLIPEPAALSQLIGIVACLFVRNKACRSERTQGDVAVICRGLPQSQVAATYGDGRVLFAWCAL